MRLRNLLKITVSGLGIAAFAGAAHAAEFNVPAGDLKAALDTYTDQSGVSVIVPSDQVRGAHTKGVKGDLTADAALSRILSGTGFSVFRYSSGAVGITREQAQPETIRSVEVAQATPAHTAASVETVVVTSSKIKGDIQTVPIAITALSQEQLTSRQIAGGPDLVKEVPNLTFSKTNFTGYNIQIRGIGTQAISVTTDPAVAVAFNDTPFIRNHFFEQEFYDVNQVEVLRGPQGTLYGRNATAGVVNMISAKPTDQFEAMASADIGNYHNRRYEGMVNVPIVDDRLDIRAAGEWTKRDGYSFNELTNSPIDGRDLWSSRVTIGVKPSANVQAYLVWEHFSENDDRMRTAKQLCNTAQLPSTIDGVSVVGYQHAVDFQRSLSQGCKMGSLYSADAFGLPFAFSLPLVAAGAINGVVNTQFNPYQSTTQSPNLRVIDTALNPVYRAKNDTVELNTDYQVAPTLTFTSQTGYNQDFLWSTEDYNRFNSAPGAFTKSTNSDSAGVTLADPAAGTNGIPSFAGVFCDPQLGCSDRIVAQDLSDEHAWQLSQEFRLTSNFSGPVNFSVGGNYLHYETEENYYVFANTLTIYSVSNLIQEAACLNQTPGPCNTGGLPWTPGVSDNHECLQKNYSGFVYQDPHSQNTTNIAGCTYIDPNPIGSLNNQGHNYFLSQNPYVLNSYAAFGEVYYNVTTDLKLIGGLRWTDDRKHFVDIPSELLTSGYGYPITGVVNQQWNQWTGRFAANWTPKLDFTDQTLLYSSYAHGYKAGGANPPGAILLTYTSSDLADPIHPLTFKPEFVDAYELGTKNTLLDGALTLNGDIFYYNYKAYQISEIVDRTALNLNFDATVHGAELETTWEPAPGLKFNFAGGYESTRLANGDHAVDLMDRTAGHPGWLVVKRFPTQASNCILPAYVIPALLAVTRNTDYACGRSYDSQLDPLTWLPYTPYPNVGDGGVTPPAGYPGFDPLSVDPTAPANVNNGLGLPPNNGEGFDKNLSGNQLPNAPHFTASLSAEYTMPVSENWAATLHSDFYWQSQSFARVFNDVPYDKIRGYSTTNLALILTSADGWQVMGYLKNVFNVTAITGDFLNSDDSGLTTNVFLTDPRLFGVRVTKNW
jgi:iron complex outermembrane recepter protein